MIAKTTLTSLACAGSLLAAASPALAAAPNGWGTSSPKSVLVQSNGRRTPTPFASQSTSQVIPEGMPVEEIAPGTIATDSFDGGVQGEGVIVGSPDTGYADGNSSDAGSYAHQEGSYGNAVEGVYGSPFNGSPFNGSYENGFEGQEPGHIPCGAPGCQGGCNACQQGSCGLPEWRYNAECEPMGLLQKMYLLHRGLKSDGCWTGRVDALILSRNAPGFRPLYTFNPGTAGTALNANQLESIAAVGPRISLFHKDQCGSASWESTYIYSGGFVSDRSLSPSIDGYLTAPPGIYGNGSPPVDTASARLTSSLQSAELNRRWCWGSCTQFLAGFRWLQWQETAAISNVYDADTPGFGQDVYTTGCYNNLFGGQIGLDTALWQPSKHFRLEGLVKAGAYYNNANQSSSYQNYVGGVPNSGNSGSAGSSPATCSFAGELGLTGVVPLCCNVDFRFGYFGLWLTSIAQPTNQLSNQVLMPPPVPTYTSLTTNGNVVLQGLSLGLEGRW
jgi:hypothetical protein